MNVYNLYHIFHFMIFNEPLIIILYEIIKMIILLWKLYNFSNVPSHSKNRGLVYGYFRYPEYILAVFFCVVPFSSRLGSGHRLSPEVWFRVHVWAFVCTCLFKTTFWWREFKISLQPVLVLSIVFDPSPTLLGTTLVLSRKVLGTMSYVVYKL